MLQLLDRQVPKGRHLLLQSSAIKAPDTVIDLLLLALGAEQAGRWLGYVSKAPSCKDVGGSFPGQKLSQAAVGAKAE